MESHRISPETARDDAIAPAILEALELSILEQKDDSLFRVHGSPPPWLREVLPGDINTAAFDITEAFPFLEVFLPDALEIVAQGGRLQSDIWTQRDHQNQERHLQAIAMDVCGRFILAIGSPNSEYEERSSVLQHSHSVQLQAERIERMRRQLEYLNAELTARNAEVERATRAKSDFLAAMSHEIRTPMNAIIGMADLLQQTDLTAEQKKYVDVFQGAGENLLVLINDILDLSKVEAGKIQLEHVDFDLEEILSNVVAIAQVRASAKGLTISYRIGSDVPVGLIGDPNRLRQVLLNLLGNSVKFTERGGVEIVVEADPESNEPGRLHFVVADTGIGIPADKLETIFESFAQADSSTTRKYGGTGLGLSISRQLIGLMGGRIWAESEVGAGAQFHFVADFALSARERTTPATQSSKADLTAMPSGVRILLADDSEDNRFLFLRYFKKTTCVVDIAENGRIAVEKFQTGDYDLVLMDVEMPEMDGYTAVRLMRGAERSKDRSIPMLALTAHAFAGAAAKSLAAGFTDHLTKPIRRSTMLDAVRKHAPSRAAADQLPPVVVDPLLEDLIPGFLEKRRQDTTKLAEALAAGDYGTVQRLGHNLKGTGAGYGFTFLSELGAQIEQAAKISDYVAIHDKLGELTRYLNSVQWIASGDPPEE